MAAAGRQNISPTVKEDSQLIDEALAGDSNAFGDLVRRYQDRLFHTLVHQVGCAEEAYDVVQEAFVQAFLKLETFRRSSAFYTWLYRIAYNAAVSRRRRAKGGVSLQDLRDFGGQEPVDPGTGPDGRMQQEELAQRVRAGLALLSEDHRMILLLREVEGFSYEEIAEVLELPVGTVRSRLHRARLQLRDQLKPVLHENRL